MNDEFRPTISERLIIGMLCDICDRLNIESYDTDVLREVVGSHPWALNLEYSFEEPIEEKVVREVMDIIDMWEWIEISYERLSEEDRAGIEDDCRFRGFDGNCESEHYSVAGVLINTMKRWKRFSGHDLNSHIPMLPEYRNMLERYPTREEMANIARSDKGVVKRPTQRYTW